jgi:hypothetical protein
MAWLPALLAVAPPVVSPIGTATGDIITYVLGYGVLGIVAVALAFGFLVPKSAVEKARDQARADISAELQRTIEEKRDVEEQRDEAMKIAQTQIVPLLVSFTATATSLIPLLQELVRYREALRDRDSRDRR